MMQAGTLKMPETNLVPCEDRNVGRKELEAAPSVRLPVPAPQGPSPAAPVSAVQPRADDLPAQKDIGG